MRTSRSTPLLYFDATADPITTEPYLPDLQYHYIDVRQLAVVSQVYDRTGSNSFWNNKIGQEQQNLSEPLYDPQQNDIAALITILNEWVKAGESPLLVGNKDLCEYLRVHPKLDEGVAIAHFMSLRGSNAFEDRSVIFITGRNQPPIDDIGQQARAIFGNSGSGKSTLANRLAEAHDLPVLDLDTVAWDPEQFAVPRDEGEAAADAEALPAADGSAVAPLPASEVPGREARLERRRQGLLAGLLAPY